jgi:hypothetical protein
LDPIIRQLVETVFEQRHIKFDDMRIFSLQK